MKTVVLLTCFNRKEKTIKCVSSLVRGNKSPVNFIVVDDGSTDKTATALEELFSAEDFEGCGLNLIETKGNLYYSGGMRRAMKEAKKSGEADFYVLANDDVEFEPGVIDRLASFDRGRVYVGALRDKSGKCSYGGVKYEKGIHYRTVTPLDADRGCDTFNANFVAVPGGIFAKIPEMDEVYVHSLGDFDYGLSIKKRGYRIEVMDEYVGVCENNPGAGTWMDASLKIPERIRLKESVKGAPAKQWFHFLKKNFGIGYAFFYSVTPYIRIIVSRIVFLLGKH